MKTNTIPSRVFCVLTLLLALAGGALAADPGIPIPQDSDTPRVNDQTRGFMLIYNIYTSSTSNPGAQNTRFSITNTNDQRGIAVHLFFVDGASCSVADRYICLTPNQTATFLASEQDPGTTGYLVALATDFFGFPTPFDYLIGDESVKFENGFFGNLGAEAVPAGSVPFADTSSDGTLAILGLIGLPRVLAVDNIGSRDDGNQTMVVINGVGGNFTLAGNSIGALFGILYDDQENSHSWTRTGGCQIVAQLDNAFPRTTPRFDVVIPAGQSGWMKFWSTTPINNLPFGTSADGRALLGAVFQRNANAGTSAAAFQGARNMHKLNLVSDDPGIFNGQGAAPMTARSSRFTSAMAAPAPTVQLTLFAFPVFPPNCGFVDSRDQE